MNPASTEDFPRSEDDIDVRSLSFDDPDFSFFESRSFFLSKFASCKVRIPEDEAPDFWFDFWIDDTMMFQSWKQQNDAKTPYLVMLDI